MKMKAIPVSAGRRCSNLVNASSPPAEAPTPTIGQDFLFGGRCSSIPRIKGSASCCKGSTSGTAIKNVEVAQ